jgi:Ca2+-binding EF-hand superfamily protein
MYNRKLLALSLVVATSVLTGEAFAQSPERPARGDGAQGPRGEMRGDRHSGPRQSPGHVIRRADTNDDGLVSLAEFLAERSEQAVRQFEHRDTDGDGMLRSTDTGPRHRALHPSIDIAEFRACIAESGGNPDLEEDPFSAADANADGSISKDEFYAHSETRASEQFARIDSNADGQLSAEELRSNIQAGREHREIVRECLADARDPLL